MFDQAHNQYLSWKQSDKNLLFIRINNKTTNDAQTISNHFNDYFTNVASELVKNLLITSHNHKRISLLQQLQIHYIQY